MLRILDQSLYFDQLYSCTVIMLSHLCRLVWHFAVMGAHTLLSPICSTPWHHLRLLSCAHTVLGSAILLYIYTLVQSLFSMGMWSVGNCTVQLYTGLWYVMYFRTGLLMWDNPHEPCQPITAQNSKHPRFMRVIFWFMRVIFRFRGVICFLHGMLTQPFCPAERAV